MNVSAAQEAFQNGKTPRKVNGFYHGTLVTMLPARPLEHIGTFLLSFFLPWKGKYFDARKRNGDNLLPYSVEPFLSWRYGKKSIGKKETEGFHAFPFQTTITRGLFDPIKILRLDYNLPHNPPRVRTVVDELVEISPAEFLGKAYLKEEHTYRTIAYFRLSKQ